MSLDKNAIEFLREQQKQMDSMSKMDRELKDEYYGWSNHSSSRRQRQSGYTESGAYWEE